MFGSWHDPIPALLAGSEKVLQNDIYDLPMPLVPFVQGRVVLLGDAAHAMTPNLGRGACSAIEDAGALARHLGRTSDLPTALTAYDAERRPATTKLVQAVPQRSAASARLDNPLLCAIRDGLVRTSAGNWPALRARKQADGTISGCDHSSAGCSRSLVRSTSTPARSGICTSSSPATC